MAQVLTKTKSKNCLCWRVRVKENCIQLKCQQRDEIQTAATAAAAPAANYSHNEQ